jgi:hypothetical protein
MKILKSTNHFKRVSQKIYWILHCLRPHASHTPFEVRRKLVAVSILMPHIGYGGIVYAGVVDTVSQRRLNMAFKGCLRYIHSLKRLIVHLSHLKTSVMGASLDDYARIKLLSFVNKVLHVRHLCLVREYKEFGSPGSSLSCNEPVLSFTWLPGIAMKILPMWASFVSAVTRTVRGVDVSN